MSQRKSETSVRYRLLSIFAWLLSTVQVAAVQDKEPLILIYIALVVCRKRNMLAALANHLQKAQNIEGFNVFR